MPLDVTPIPTGTDVQVNTHTATNQIYPSVTALGDSGFVVTWSSSGQDGSSSGIYGQRYNAAGVADGAEFKINTETAGTQIHSSVRALGGGGFVVTWSSFDQDGSNYGIYGQRYDAAGVADGAEFKINTHTTSAQENSSVTALGDGGFVVTWSSFGQDGSSYGIYGQRYDAAGAAAGAELQINTHTASDQAWSSVTALVDGGFVVTWSSLDQDGSGYGIYGQRYDAAGVADGAEFQINTETTGDQAYSSATALGDGGFVVTWSGQDGSGYGIYGQRYDVNGMTVGGEFQINTHTASEQLYPSVTALVDGGFVVTWSSLDQDGSGWGIYGQRYDSNGMAVGNEFRLNSITNFTQYNESFWGSEWVDTLADGRLVAVWSGFGAEEVFFRLVDVPFNPTPVPTGTDVQVNTHTAGDQIFPSVTALGDGGFVVTWTSLDQDGSDYGIYGQRYDPAGVAVGAEFRVNTQTASSQLYSSVTALGDGGFVVTWSSSNQDGSGYGIYGQRYDVNGMTVGGEFQINTETASAQLYPSVTALGDGGFVVTWTSFLQDGSGWGIYGQRYDANGDSVGVEFRVNTHTANDQIYSSVTGLDDGGFVVTWSSSGQDGSFSGIYGQRYDAAGAAVGAEFRINTETASDQTYSSVTALGDGGFVVTWSGQDGSGYGIYGQRYDVNGMTVGGEFQINTETASAQLYPSVTALGDGGFVVTWTSFLQDGSGWGIYGQRYDANGIAVGNEFRLNSITAGDQINDSYVGSEGLATLADGRLVAVWSGFGAEEVFFRLVDVPPVNTAPSSAGGAVATEEDAAYTFSLADFDFADADTGDELHSVTIVTLPADGTLFFDATGGAPDDAAPVAANDAIAAADIAAGKLFFVPDANGNDTPYTTFSYTVSDGTDSSAPATMTIDVTAVNDAPVGTDATATTDEDTTYVFDADDFGFTDPDDSPANAFAAVKITSLPAAGLLLLAGNAVNDGDVIAVTDSMTAIWSTFRRKMPTAPHSQASPSRSRMTVTR